jgi:hypothetical protein
VLHLIHVGCTALVSLALTLTAAVGNAAVMFVPWREWLQIRRGRLLLDLWCGGLIGFVALLVTTGGPNFALLLFLAIPFIAVVQVGWRRGFWLAVSAGTCALAAALVPLPAGATAMGWRWSQPPSQSRSSSPEQSAAKQPRTSAPLHMPSSSEH